MSSLEMKGIVLKDLAGSKYRKSGEGRSGKWSEVEPEHATVLVPLIVIFVRPVLLPLLIGDVKRAELVQNRPGQPPELIHNHTYWVEGRLQPGQNIGLFNSNRPGPFSIHILVDMFFYPFSLEMLSVSG